MKNMKDLIEIIKNEHLNLLINIRGNSNEDFTDFIRLELTDGTWISIFNITEEFLESCEPNVLYEEIEMFINDFINDVRGNEKEGEIDE